VEIAARKQELTGNLRVHVMSAQTSPTTGRQIVWPSVITVISAAILIGAEVFGAAFAGGWALAIIMPPDTFNLSVSHDAWAHGLQAVLFAVGVLIMIAFIRAAQLVEPFTRRR
jgi:fatty acid desaturase